MSSGLFSLNTQRYICEVLRNFAGCINKIEKQIKFYDPSESTASSEVPFLRWLTSQRGVHFGEISPEVLCSKLGVLKWRSVFFEGDVFGEALGRAAVPRGYTKRTRSVKFCKAGVYFLRELFIAFVSSLVCVSFTCEIVVNRKLL